MSGWFAILTLAQAASSPADTSKFDYVGGPLHHIMKDIRGDEKELPNEARMEVIDKILTSEREHRPLNRSGVLVPDAVAKSGNGFDYSFPEGPVKLGFLSIIEGCKPHFPRQIDKNLIRILWSCGEAKRSYLTFFSFQGNAVAKIDTYPLQLPAVTVRDAK